MRGSMGSEAPSSQPEASLSSDLLLSRSRKPLKSYLHTRTVSAGSSGKATRSMTSGCMTDGLLYSLPALTSNGDKDRNRHVEKRPEPRRLQVESSVASWAPFRDHVSSKSPQVFRPCFPYGMKQEILRIQVDQVHGKEKARQQQGALVHRRFGDVANSESDRVAGHDCRSQTRPDQAGKALV